jgi:hypothetical protein
MKTLIAMLLCSGLTFLQGPAQAQQRLYHQGELDAMLAPIALYPDGLLSQILIAATYPDEVAEAARWSRDNPQLSGQDAVRAVSDMDWDASVKSLVAFPDVLARMDESPQWTRDLGQAFLQQEPHVMDTVQGLRQRARNSGHLQSNDQYAVQQQGEAIVVQPVQPHVVYVNYYDPFLVYGPWWWPAYRPVYWRPWAPRPIFVTSSFFYAAPAWRHRHVRVVHRPYYVHHTHTHVVPGRWQPRPSARAYVRVPEANRRPIVNSAPPLRRIDEQRREQRAPATIRGERSLPERRSVPERGQRSFEQRQLLQRQAQMPAAPGFSHAPREQPRAEARRERPRQQNREMRQHRGNGRG